MPQRLFRVSPFSFVKYAFLIFCISTVGYIAFFPSYSRIKELQNEKHELRQQISKLENDIAELKDEHKIMENKVYLEKIARDEFGMSKKGDVIVKINRGNSLEEDDSRGGAAR